MRRWRRLKMQIGDWINQMQISDGINLAMAVGTWFAVLVALGGTFMALNQTRKLFEFQNRPFVAVVEPFFVSNTGSTPNDGSIGVEYHVESFSDRPIHGYLTASDKIMCLGYSEADVIKRVRAAESPLIEELGVEETFLRLRERPVLLREVRESRAAMLGKLFEYLKSKPMASYTNIISALSSIKIQNGEDERGETPPPSGTALLPRTKKFVSSSETIWHSADAAAEFLFKARECFLVYFSYITYEGATPGSSESTYFMGFYDPIDWRQDLDVVTERMPITEYRQWRGK